MERDASPTFSPCLSEDNEPGRNHFPSCVSLSSFLPAEGKELNLARLQLRRFIPHAAISELFQASRVP